ncbi:hypothetical protein [Flexivirga sp.]|uniref:hypothetical protein n=1 Tax=Flexivirga sp. TaxID=1962927 RepID=UPI003F7F9981
MFIVDGGVYPPPLAALNKPCSESEARNSTDPSSFAINRVSVPSGTNQPLPASAVVTADPDPNVNELYAKPNGCNCPLIAGTFQSCVETIRFPVPTSTDADTCGLIWNGTRVADFRTPVSVADATDAACAAGAAHTPAVATSPVDTTATNNERHGTRRIKFPF